MDALFNISFYSPEFADQIRSLGPLGIAIANRWSMTWPGVVRGLIKAGTYLNCLETQLKLERDAKAIEVQFWQLARGELLELYEAAKGDPPENEDMEIVSRPHQCLVYFDKFSDAEVPEAELHALARIGAGQLKKYWNDKEEILRMMNESLVFDYRHHKLVTRTLFELGEYAAGEAIDEKWTGGMEFA